MGAVDEDGKRVILFLDNHSTRSVQRAHAVFCRTSLKSYRFSLEVLDFARANGVEIIGFPSNSTHILQPADLSVFGPMKHYASVARAAFAQRGVISRSNIVHVLSQAVLAAASPQNIISGWARAGLVPFNPEAVLERKKQVSGDAEGSDEKKRAKAERKAKKREEKDSGAGGVSRTLVDGVDVEVPYDFEAFLDKVSLQPDSLSSQRPAALAPRAHCLSTRRVFWLFPVPCRGLRKRGKGCHSASFRAC